MLDRLRGCLRGVCNGPDEAERLARDSRDRDDGELAACGEPAVARAEAMACLVCDGAHGGTVTLGLRGYRFAGPRVGPCRLDQGFACASIAGLGQPAAAHAVAGRVFARHQAEIAHQLAWVVEA